MLQDRMLPIVHALRRRCPRCGGGSLFTGWFQMVPVCPTCRLDFERNPGAFIGGIGLNTMVTFGAIVAAIVLAFVFTGADRTTISVLAPPVAVAVLVPIVFFPWSKTLWLAIELITSPPDPESDAAQ